ncbi:hypothetical protein Pint_31285 [Pistacia integerrima]|uniref:Uncharacterized protein n=1 Tax=Pistacia integerrima TaxID=434235 RepID=A0ACC0XNW4_9ROSI|nr:hypothetical protein Pint_31285 [Pistacia integerrima]
MDSQWFNEAAQNMNDQDLPSNNAGNTVDLTLKLGLPNNNINSEKNKQIQFDFAPLAPNLPTQPPPQGKNQNEIANSNNIIGGQNSNANNFAWQSKLENQFHAPFMQPNEYGFGQFSAGVSSSTMPPPTPFPMYSNPYYYNLNFNKNPNPNPIPNSNPNPNSNFVLPPPPPTMNNYTLLDVPARRAMAKNLGSSSSSRRHGSRQQQHVENYNDQCKRCTNYNCNTNDTPMWRRGPLGPKTLCNACGIKYRKEEEKRKAKEAARNRDSNNEYG